MDSFGVYGACEHRKSRGGTPISREASALEDISQFLRHGSMSFGEPVLQKPVRSWSRKMVVSAGLTKRLSARTLSLIGYLRGSTSPVNRRPLSLRVCHFGCFSGTAILWGRGQLDALFNLDWCSEDCPKGEGQKLLELRPKKPLATLERMVVQIDAGTYQILGATSYDPMGNQTIYTLSKPTLGKVHKENWFEFQVPDGVNVIRVNVAGTPVKP